ncbi:MAG: Trm112 family protein [Thalassobaculaceae bacterium]
MPDTDNAGPAGRGGGGQEGRAIDPKLLEILVCPMTKGPLVYDRDGGELISRQGGLAYPVRDGVPIMLIDEARRLADDPVAGGRAALDAADKPS